MSKTYENLVETSNQHNDAVYDYLEEHGANEAFHMLIIGKLRWLKIVSEEHGIEVD